MEAQKFGNSFLFVFILSLALTSIISTSINYYFGKFEPNFSSQIEKLEIVNDPNETFYSIGDNSIQLVISSKGASISEINIPFQSSKSQTSVVPLSIDKKLRSKESILANFPLKTTLHSTKSGLVEIEKTKNYYPLLRRSVKPGNRFGCLHLISEYEDLESIEYKLVYIDSKKIVLEGQDNLRTIKKTFEVSNDSSNIIECTIQIDGDSRGFWISSGVLDIEIVSGKPSNNVFTRYIRNGISDSKSISLPQKQICESLVDIEWIANTNGFFAVILEPENFLSKDLKVECVSSDRLRSRFYEDDKSEFGLNDGYRSMLKLPPNNGNYKIKLFAGPILDKLLDDIDGKIHSSSYSPKYKGYLDSKSWFSIISSPFSKILSYLLPKLFLLTGSWTLAIILLTLFLRIVLYPLNAWSISSIEKIKQLAPIVATIQEKYKHDQNRAKIEIFNLYRQHNINPFYGLIPLFAQMPFLFGMFDVLRSRFELRGACAIPGWIDNLAAPDVIFSWKTSLPIIGNELHLLPIILGLIMFAQQKITTQNLSQSNSNNFGLFMTLFFVLMFYNFPAGLNIYWMFSIIFALIQQVVTKKISSNIS